MYNLIGHIFYHVLIVLFPVLFYHLFIDKEQRNTRNNIGFLFVILVMLLLTMSSPLEFSNGFSYDFRLIPVIIAFLYGGILQGVFVILTIIIYQFFFADGPALLMTINYAIVGSLLIFLARKYEKINVVSKCNLITALLVLIGVTRSIPLLVTKEYSQLQFSIIFILLTWMTIITIIYFIENLKQQALLQKELQRSEKLNVISQLAASVAHEVRNPMTSINGFLQLMDTDSNITDTQKRYIEISLHELNRAQTIINEYLSLAKPNTSGVKAINISEELNKVVELMMSYTNIQNVVIETSIQDSLYIKGNKDEIRQVLINIIKNGIEAIGAHGVLKINCFVKNGMIMIEVIDNGVGMTRGQLKNIGTPFYSTKDKGTGIGLTISYQMVELMKGKIHVASEVGQGTTFTIIFPRCEESLRESS